MAPFTAYVGDFNRFQTNTIDTGTDTLGTVIGSPAVYSGHLELNVNYSNTTVAVSDFNHTLIQFIDVASATYTSNVSVATGTISNGWTHDDLFLFVGGTNAVYVIDIGTSTVVNTISTPGSSQFTDAAITPDGLTFIFVTTAGAWFIDVGSRTVFGTVAGDFFGGIAISLDGQKAYCGQFNTGGGQNQVAILDVPAMTQTGTIIIPGINPQPLVPRITPSGLTCLITNNGNNTLSFIDVATDTVVNTISDPSFSLPTFLAITPDGAKAYISNQTNQKVTVVNVPGQSVITSIPVPGANTLYGISIVPPAPPVPPTPPTPGTTTVPPLFIPRKTSLAPSDLTASFLAVERWANAL